MDSADLRQEVIEYGQLLVEHTLATDEAVERVVERRARDTMFVFRYSYFHGTAVEHDGQHALIAQEKACHDSRIDRHIKCKTTVNDAGGIHGGHLAIGIHAQRHHPSFKSR
jgi:hypothetical protein